MPTDETPGAARPASQSSFGDSRMPGVVATQSTASSQKMASPTAISSPCDKLHSAAMLSGRTPLDVTPDSTRRRASERPTAVPRASHPRSFAASSTARRNTITRNNALPVRTPICPDRKSPTRGLKKIHGKVPCTNSTANTTSHTAFALPRTIFPPGDAARQSRIRFSA